MKFSERFTRLWVTEAQWNVYLATGFTDRHTRTQYEPTPFPRPLERLATPIDPRLFTRKMAVACVCGDGVDDHVVQADFHCPYAEGTFTPLVHEIHKKILGTEPTVAWYMQRLYVLVRDVLAPAYNDIPVTVRRTSDGTRILGYPPYVEYLRAFRARNGVDVASEDHSADIVSVFDGSKLPGSCVKCWTPVSLHEKGCVDSHVPRLLNFETQEILEVW